MGTVFAAEPTETTTECTKLCTMAGLFRIMVVAVALIGCVAGQDCARWCEDDQGRFYCCHDGVGIVGGSEVHPGNCPPIREECKATGTRFKRPKVCSDDAECTFS